MNKQTPISHTTTLALAAVCILTLPQSPVQAQGTVTIPQVVKTNVQAQIVGLASASGTLYFTDEQANKLNQLELSAQRTLKPLAEGFSQPKGIAIDIQGNLYVADSENHSIRRVDTAGNVTTIAGGTAGLLDGDGATAQFHGPRDIAIAKDGSLYIADTLNHRIRKIDTQGSVQTVAGTGTEKDADGWLIGAYKDGKATEARFNEPSSLTFDAKGNLYIADTGNQRIRMLTTDGMVKTIAGSGTEKVENRYIKGGYLDGKALQARFNSPLGIDIAPNGSLYVADTWNNRIREVTPEGMVKTIAGGAKNGFQDGWGVEATFDGPTDVDVQADGSIYVADRWNRAIRKLTMTNVPTLASTQDVRLLINEQPLMLKTKPTIIAGSTYLPLREIAESLQFDVQYHPQTKHVSVKKGTVTSTLTKEKMKIVNSHTMMHVRELGEFLNMQVEWVPSYRLVVLTSK